MLLLQTGAQSHLRRKAAQQTQRLPQSAGPRNFLLEKAGIGWLVAHGHGKDNKDLLEQGEDCPALYTTPGRGVADRLLAAVQAALQPDEDGHDVDKAADATEDGAGAVGVLQTVGQTLEDARPAPEQWRVIVF